MLCWKDFWILVFCRSKTRDPRPPTLPCMIQLLVNPQGNAKILFRQLKFWKNRPMFMDIFVQNGTHV